MRVQGILLSAIGLGLVGCWNPSPRSYELDYGYGYSNLSQPVVVQPESGVDSASVTSALHELALREADARERAAQRSNQAQLPVEEAVVELRAAYGRADAFGAAALIASHPQLMSWDEAERDGLIAVQTTCERHGGEGHAYVALSLPATRVDAPALAIALPPGTYGVLAETVAPTGASEGERWVNPRDDRRYGNWPAVQDLAFLGAGAVILDAATPVVRLRVPVACASFEKGAPQHGMRFDLRRFPSGSAVERLLVQLCADRNDTTKPAEAQVAVWLARNRISWDAFVKHGGPTGRLATFSGNGTVQGHHAAGAARLLLESGTDPRGLGFFKDGEDTGPVDVPAAELFTPAEAHSEQAPEANEPAPEVEPELEAGAASA